MCRPMPCAQCGQTTWAGCGDHVADVKAHVPDDQWCGHTGQPGQPDGPAQPRG